MEMTIETCKRLDRELWFWMENRPEKRKRDWPRWEFNGGDIPKVENLCFVCDYCGTSCYECPKKWPGEFCVDMEGTEKPGVFARWDDAESSEISKIKRLARAIRLMPWKDERK